MFSSLFNWLMGAGRELAVVLISMVPLVELRGAVPLGRGRRRTGDRADPAGCDRQYDPDPVFTVLRRKAAGLGVLARPAFRLCHQVP